MIVRMKLATPTEGLITLSDQLNPALFRMAKVGLGSLGVVTELTLQCIPSHHLRERMYTTTIDKIHQKHKQRLRNFRHVRYMWLPHTDSVVVVISNPVDGIGLPSTVLETELAAAEADVAAAIKANRSDVSIAGAPTTALVELYLTLNPDIKRAEVECMSFSQLRDALLDISPLDTEHIKRVNRAEAEFWLRSSGERTADSTEILGFDCGGEQWVLEVRTAED